jgi:hypothetical protein
MEEQYHAEIRSDHRMTEVQKLDATQAFAPIGMLQQLEMYSIL